jgi:hypothetical protein
MARRRGQRETDEGPSDADLERFSSVTRECPECGAELYDDAEVCWKCGHAFSSAPNWPTKAWVWIVAAGAIAALMLVLVWR